MECELESTNQLSYLGSSFFLSFAFVRPHLFASELKQFKAKA